MSLAFSKMHGLGNDFMVIDAVTQEVGLSAERIQAWSDRHCGIGFDQLLLVEPPTRPDIDFRYRIFNADGSEVEQCGNGARCFAAFVRRRGLSTESSIRVETMAGDLQLEVLPDARVRVNMGEPELHLERVPVALPARAERDGDQIVVPLAGRAGVPGVAVSMGNPHLVTRQDELHDGLVEQLGPALENHDWFPARVNVGFLQVMDSTHARLRVYERGVGETRACGSGACAALVAAVSQGWMSSPARLDLLGGSLELAWNGPGTGVWMTGPATHVYDGWLELDSDNL